MRSYIHILIAASVLGTNIAAAPIAVAANEVVDSNFGDASKYYKRAEEVVDSNFGDAAQYYRRSDVVVDSNFGDAAKYYKREAAAEAAKEAVNFNFGFTDYLGKMKRAAANMVGNLSLELADYLERK